MTLVDQVRRAADDASEASAEAREAKEVAENTQRLAGALQARLHEITARLDQRDFTDKLDHKYAMRLIEAEKRIKRLEVAIVEMIRLVGDDGRGDLVKFEVLVREEWRAAAQFKAEVRATNENESTA